MLLYGRSMDIDRFRFWLSLGWLRPRRASFRFTKILCSGEVFVFVVGSLVGEDNGLLAFEHVALLPVGLV